MMRFILPLMVLAGPAAAATGPFFSLGNTDFVVLIAFLIFVGILVYAGVPAKLGGLLDGRADTIRSELAEARALRDEAQTLLASFERKKKDVQEQADRIVANARDEANAAAAEAREELKRSIERRLATATDRITSAEQDAVRAVREQAIQVAVAAAGDLLARQMTPDTAAQTIDASIAEVGKRLH